MQTLAFRRGSITLCIHSPRPGITVWTLLALADSDCHDNRHASRHSRAINHGLLPPHYLSDGTAFLRRPLPDREIAAEGLGRSCYRLGALPDYSRMPRGNSKESERRPFGPSPVLFPVAKRVNADADRRSELDL